MKRLLTILILAIAIFAVASQPVKASDPLQTCLNQASDDFTSGFNYCVTYGHTQDVIAVCLEANSRVYQNAMTACYHPEEN